MKITFYILSIITTLAIIGCGGVGPIAVGTNFKAEPLNNITVGRTTKNEIISQFGVPKETRKIILNDTEYEVFIYSYSDWNIHVYLYADPNMQKRSPNYKRLTCEFKNNLLNAYDFESTFKDDQITIFGKSNFNIQKGKTTKNDIQNIFGIPSSKAYTPTTIEFVNAYSGAHEMWRYSYRYEKDISGEPKIFLKSLSIFFDAHGLVIDSNYYEEL